MITLNRPIKPDLKKLNYYLARVNNSGWYTNFGPLHQELTERLEDYLGVKNLLLVSNGTLALQVAYKTFDIRNTITTPFSFVATASSLIWQGIETSFCDIDSKSYNLSPKEVKKAILSNPSIDSIVATHVYGNPCDVNSYNEVQKENNVKVIYDSAHAFGVKVGGKSVLSYGDASTLSFHATKVFHTVEGGAVVFRKKADFDRAKKLINFGLDEQGNISDVGINAKLNEYQCAVGLTILDEIDNILEHRSSLFHDYRLGLDDLVEMPEWHESASFNGSYMPIKLSSPSQQSKVIKKLTDNNIQSRKYFSPSLDTIFTECKNYGTKNSRNISENILCLPLHSSMTKQDVNKVIDVLKGSGVL